MNIVFDDMTDAEISRRLALDIGWEPDQFYKDGDGSFVALRSKRDFGSSWSIFDYRNPEVIWPIAERFNAFPKLYHGAGWLSERAPLSPHHSFYTATAAKAVALAVIYAKEK